MIKTKEQLIQAGVDLTAKFEREFSLVRTAGINLQAKPVVNPERYMRYVNLTLAIVTENSNRLGLLIDDLSRYKASVDDVQECSYVGDIGPDETMKGMVPIFAILEMTLPEAHKVAFHNRCDEVLGNMCGLMVCESFAKQISQAAGINF